MKVEKQSPKNKTNLYVVQNGIGKVSLFTNFIDELCERDGMDISILSPYPELFSQHPRVKSNLLLGVSNHEVLNEYFNEIIYVEPYLSNYMKGNEHILVSWRYLLGLKTENFDDYTEVFTDDSAKKYYENVKQHLQKPYIIVQLKGGTTVYNDNKRDDNMVMRNYINEYDLIKSIHDSFKNHYIMVVKTHNDIYDERVDKLERICTLEDESLLVIQEMINNSETFVSIDSCIQHLSCNRENPKKGIVLWSNVTKPNQIGHNLHVNIQSESANDIKVSNDLIIDELKKILNYV